MDHYFTLGTVNVVLQMLDNTALAESVKTLSDCGGIHQVSGADLASDHFIDAADVDLPFSSGDGSQGCRSFCHPDSYSSVISIL